MAGYICVVGRIDLLDMGDGNVGLSANAVTLDENDIAIAPQGWTQVFLPMQSSEPVEGSDDEGDFRRKVVAAFWDAYAQLDRDEDTVEFKFI